MQFRIGRSEILPSHPARDPSVFGATPNSVRVIGQCDEFHLSSLQHFAEGALHVALGINRGRPCYDETDRFFHQTFDGDGIRIQLHVQSASSTEESLRVE